jgi:hypothetical protein
MRDVVGKACELLRERLAAGWVVITGDPEAIEIVRDRVYSRHEKEFKLLLPVKYTGGMDIFIAKKREELRRLILSTNDEFTEWKMRMALWMYLGYEGSGVVTAKTVYMRPGKEREDMDLLVMTLERALRKRPKVKVKVRGKEGGQR